jgi:hypothetical protein
MNMTCLISFSRYLSNIMILQTCIHILFFRHLVILHQALRTWQVLVLCSAPVSSLQPVLVVKVGIIDCYSSLLTNKFIIDPESQPDMKETNLDGCLLIIPWSCLIVLLGICKHPGCGDQVLLDNMDISRNGIGAL